MSDLERLRFYIKRLKFYNHGSQQEIGKLIGYEDKTYFSRILNGHTKAPAGFEDKLTAIDPRIVEDWKEHEESLIENENSLIKLSDGIPYYDVDFAGGFKSEEVFANVIPSFYITSPDFKRADFACNLYGNSISRRIPNEAVIGLRQVEDWETYFPTNELYAVVMKNDLRTVKIVKRGKDNTLVLLPDPLPEYDQTGYEPEEVDINFVSKFFQVVAWGQFKKIAM